MFHEMHPYAHSPFMFVIFPARKRSLRRLCFYRCLSVHRRGIRGRGACVAGGMCMVGGVHGQ